MAGAQKEYTFNFNVEFKKKLDNYTGDLTEKFKRYFDDMLAEPKFVDNILEVRYVPGFNDLRVVVELKHAESPTVMINHLNRIPDYIS